MSICECGHHEGVHSQWSARCNYRYDHLEVLNSRQCGCEKFRPQKDNDTASVEPLSVPVDAVWYYSVLEESKQWLLESFNKVYTLCGDGQDDTSLAFYLRDYGSNLSRIEEEQARVQAEINKHTEENNRG